MEARAGERGERGDSPSRYISIFADVRLCLCTVSLECVLVGGENKNRLGFGVWVAGSLNRNACRPRVCRDECFHAFSGWPLFSFSLGLRVRGRRERVGVRALADKLAGLIGYEWRKPRVGPMPPRRREVCARMAERLCGCDHYGNLTPLSRSGMLGMAVVESSRCDRAGTPCEQSRF